jgi:hypothetical protein
LRPRGVITSADGLKWSVPPYTSTTGAGDSSAAWCATSCEADPRCTAWTVTQALSQCELPRAISFSCELRFGKHKRTECAPAADRQHTHRRRLAQKTAENGRQKNETPRAKHTTTAPSQQRVAQRQTTTALDNSPPRSGIKENDFLSHTPTPAMLVQDAGRQCGAPFAPRFGVLRASSGTSGTSTPHTGKALLLATAGTAASWDLTLRIFVDHSIETPRAKHTTTAPSQQRVAQRPTIHRIASVASDDHT